MAALLSCYVNGTTGPLRDSVKRPSPREVAVKCGSFDGPAPPVDVIDPREPGTESRLRDA